jgi:hypothetical protein
VFVPGLGNELALDPSLMPGPTISWASAQGLEYTHALTANVGSRPAPTCASAGTRTPTPSTRAARRFRPRSSTGSMSKASSSTAAASATTSLDNASYRDTASLVAQWNRRLSLRTRVALGGEAHRIRYRTEPTKSSSSDLYAASAGVTYVLQPATLTAATGSLYFGNDQAVAGRADGDRRLYGASVGLQRRLLERAEV